MSYSLYVTDPAERDLDGKSVRAFLDGFEFQHVSALRQFCRALKNLVEFALDTFFRHALFFGKSQRRRARAVPVELNVQRSTAAKHQNRGGNDEQNRKYFYGDLSHIASLHIFIIRSTQSIVQNPIEYNSTI